MEYRVPLAVESYRTCSARLRPGQVTRVQQRGPLIGYKICCPGPTLTPFPGDEGDELKCGFVGSYLDKEVGYIEEPPGTVRLPVGGRRTIVRTTNEVRCFKCKRLLRVEAGELVARDP